MSFVSGGVLVGSMATAPAPATEPSECSADTTSSDLSEEKCGTDVKNEGKENILAEQHSPSPAVGGENQHTAGSDSKPEEEANRVLPDDFGVNPFECRMCHVALSSQEMLDKHMTSEKHKLAMRAAAELASPSQHYCHICRLALNSVSQYGQHMTSKKHLHAERAALSNGERGAPAHVPPQLMSKPLTRPTDPPALPAGMDFADDFFGSDWNGMEQLPSRRRPSRLAATSAQPSNAQTVPQQRPPPAKAAAAAAGAAPSASSEPPSPSVRSRGKGARGRGRPGQGHHANGRAPPLLASCPRDVREREHMSPAWRGRGGDARRPPHHQPHQAPWGGGGGGYGPPHGNGGGGEWWHEEEQRRRWDEEQRWHWNGHPAPPAHPGRSAGTDRYFHERQPHHYGW